MARSLRHDRKRRGRGGSSRAVGAHDIAHGGVEERINEDRQSGIRSGVNGTPTFFINGARYAGLPDDGSLLAALESASEIRSS
jgi:protein-disulfide isomerase